MANDIDTYGLEVDGYVRQRKELESLLMSDKAMEKKVQKIIRKVLLQARSAISKDASDNMLTDPRKAYQAVKSSVYRRILGGSVSILSKRKAGKRVDYRRPMKLTAGQRGGNRRPRSQRTIDLQSYAGSDRGFILRFLNAGVHGRFVEFQSDSSRERVNRGSQGGDVKKYGKTINTGSRGSITARNFFGNSSHTAMQKAAEQLEILIDELIKKELR